jgi:uncharacterized protein YlbG (UPF0298 family)
MMMESWQKITMVAYAGARHFYVLMYMNSGILSMTKKKDKQFHFANAGLQMS